MSHRLGRSVPMRERPAWMSILVAAIAACLLAGCGSGESESGSAGTTTTAGETNELPPPGQRCRGGPTRPLELKAVIETGRRHGITLYSDPACQPDPTVVSQGMAQLINKVEPAKTKTVAEGMRAFRLAWQKARKRDRPNRV